MRFLKRWLYVPAADVQTEGCLSEATGAFLRRWNEVVQPDYQVDPTKGYTALVRRSVAKWQESTLGALNADGFVGPETARRMRVRLIGDS